MKTLLIVVPFALLSLVAGCGTVNHAQYQVTGPRRADNTQAAVSADERERVREILTTIAARFKLKDFTETCLVSNVIVYFQEEDSDNPIKLTARHMNGKVLIDLMRTLPEMGETLRHQALKETLLSELKNAFGDRVSPSNFRKPVPAPAPL